jgi:hypothetical protein
MDVDNEAFRFACSDIVQKGFCRRKPLHAESMRRQEADKALQHAWVVFNDGNGMHAIANPESFAGDSTQSFSICEDTTSQLNAFPELYAYRIYRKASAGDLPALQTTLPQRAQRRYAKSNVKADICGRPTQVSSTIIDQDAAVRDLAC